MIKKIQNLIKLCENLEEVSPQLTKLFSPNYLEANPSIVKELDDKFDKLKQTSQELGKDLKQNIQKYSQIVNSPKEKGIIQNLLNPNTQKLSTQELLAKKDDLINKSNQITDQFKHKLALSNTTKELHQRFIQGDKTIPKEALK